MINVYVAGKALRRELPLLEGIIWLEPYIYGDDIGEKDSAVYVPRDLMLLNRADVILLLVETGEELNTFVEVGIAYARGIPIILVVDPELRERTRFLETLCASVFEKRDDAIDALEIIGGEAWRVRLQELCHQGVEDGNNTYPRRRK